MALRFVEEGWSVKAMHRLMLTSSAYRQSAENPDQKAESVDPENHLLWRFNRRRLEAEEIRDSIFWVSGRLNLERGGPSVFPPVARGPGRFRALWPGGWRHVGGE